MAACPRCGETNAERARFCQSCSIELRADEETPVTRRIVSVVFVDIVGSTALGEELDPEVLRELQVRYFETVRQKVEAYGGMVEKYIGDAVVAVFGADRIHEDDALRAARAAAAIRRSIGEANDRRGAFPAFEVRIGVNTGPVAVGDPASGHGFITGDAVNTAARLEQAAEPGEILLSEATLRHAHHGITVEARPPLELRGKAARVEPFRLVDVAEGAQERSAYGPLVGRDHELGQLREAFRRASRESSCVMVTLIGVAGIGKSRLVSELVAELKLSEATALHGRCPAYGDPVGLLPVAELVGQVAGVGAEHSPESVIQLIAGRMPHRSDREAIAARVAGAVGLGGETGEADEAFWAIRQFLEASAKEHPLVIVIDDLQWAQPTLLSLLEYLAQFVVSAPMLVVGSARREFLDATPDWGTGVSHLLLELGPLDVADAESVTAGLLGGDALADEVGNELRRVSAGNPLFLLETLSYWIERGSLIRRDDQWVKSQPLAPLPVPESIGALLAARIDRLAPGERDLLRSASVVGEVFAWGAVRALLPGGSVGMAARLLMGLVRRGEIVPLGSSPDGEDAFRFRHILLRDAAYEGLPKGTRADLHERYAGWLEKASKGELPAFEESAGSHLDQAVRYRHAMGRNDERTAALADTAASYLERAGERAAGFGAPAHAIELFERALELVADDGGRRARILFSLRGAAGYLRDQVRIQQIDADLERIAEESLPEIREILGLHRAIYDVFYDPNAISLAQARQQALRAIAAGESMAEDRYLGFGLSMLSELDWTGGRIADALHSSERALKIAQRTASGAPYVAKTIVVLMEYGPTPLGEAIRRANQLLPLAQSNPWAESQILAELALFHGMNGDLDRLHDYLARVLGMGAMGLDTDLQGELLWTLGQSYEVAGDSEAAQDYLRQAWEHWQRRGHTGNLGMLVWEYGRTLCQFEQYDAAQQAAEAVKESAGRFDVWAQAAWRGVMARVALHRGDLARADLLSSEATDIASTTDFIGLRADIALDRAELLHALRRAAEANENAENAILLHQLKENRWAAQRACTLKDSLEDLT